MVAVVDDYRDVVVAWSYRGDYSVRDPPEQRLICGCLAEGMFTVCGGTVPAACFSTLKGSPRHPWSPWVVCPCRDVCLLQEAGLTAANISVTRQKAKGGEMAQAHFWPVVSPLIASPIESLAFLLLGLVLSAAAPL
jgi:hypothetical protein